MSAGGHRGYQPPAGQALPKGSVSSAPSYSRPSHVPSSASQQARTYSSSSSRPTQPRAHPVHHAPRSVHPHSHPPSQHAHHSHQHASYHSHSHSRSHTDAPVQQSSARIPPMSGYSSSNPRQPRPGVLSTSGQPNSRLPFPSSAPASHPPVPLGPTPPKNANGRPTMEGRNEEENGSRKQLARIPPPFGGLGERSVDAYQQLGKIGEGTYGKVYKARSRSNPDEFVALKEIRMENEKEGFPITAIREIKILKFLQHENIVALKEVVSSRGSKYERDRVAIYMVFEYMDHDLTGLQMTYGEHFSRKQMKCYMKQLLEGLYHCHSKNVLHRDIKGSNLLINNKGQLKLADFGLARPYLDQPSVKYTNRVITLWYRPPELLLGATTYGPAIDIWSAGCILAELLRKGRPLFPGRAEADQVDKIFRVCGSPTDENWKDAKKLPLYNTLVKWNMPPFPRKIREVFKDCSPDTIDLLDRMLTLDPAKRITANEALDHDFFWTDPMPAQPEKLPIYQKACHDYQVKKRKANMDKTSGARPGIGGSATGDNKRMRDASGQPQAIRLGANQHPPRISSHPQPQARTHPPAQPYAVHPHTQARPVPGQPQQQRPQPMGAGQPRKPTSRPVPQ